MIKRIISGGQTGADRAALDFAIKMDLPQKPVWALERECRSAKRLP
jgi:hypothetical protein